MEKGSGKWYAVRKQKVCKVVVIGNHSYKRKKVDKRKTIRMHNVLMEPSEGFIAHHKDGDGLNNQRYNLENVTKLKNQQEASVKRIENKKEKKTDDIPF